MTRRTLAIAAGLVVTLGIVLPGSGARAQAQRSGSEQTFRTPLGDPDIQGLFTTDDELGVPFERPEQFGDREVVSEQEFAQRQTQAVRQAETDAEEFVAPRTAGRGGGDGTGPPAHWLERGRPSRRTSIVISPANGRIPYLNDEARKRAAIAVNARTTGNRPFDGPQAMDLYDRCITRGLPHVIFPTIYNNTSQIVQGPGYVAIRYEMIHDARVIPLDGRPQLSSAIRQYFGDSRGHWEGDTLVVDTIGVKESVRYQNVPHSKEMRIRERMRLVAAETLWNEITIEDHTVLEKPWTFTFAYQRMKDYTLLEYICEDNREFADDQGRQQIRVDPSAR
jgi:hypothetical protein